MSDFQTQISKARGTVYEYLDAEAFKNLFKHEVF